MPGAGEEQPPAPLPEAWQRHHGAAIFVALQHQERAAFAARAADERDGDDSEQRGPPGERSHGARAAMMDLSPEELTAVHLSLRIAVVATLASLPLGVFVAYALARWRFPGKVLVDGFVHLPLVLPPVVTGYVLLLLFGRRGPIGAFLAENFGIVFSFRWTGAALACAVMGFPLMVRAIRLSIEAIDQRLENAAGTLGANRAWTFVLVTLPLALPGLMVGSILCFAKALGEFGATITFVSNIPGETQTISAAIYSLTQTPTGDAAALRLTIVSIVIALVALVLSEVVQRLANRKLAQF